MASDFHTENGFLIDIYECDMMEDQHVGNKDKFSDEPPF